LRTALACAGIAGALAVQPSSTQAQVSGGLGLTSDYRVRGISFSAGRPAVSVSLSGDFANGVYLGATAIGQDVTESDIRLLGDIEYVGYARRFSNGLTWETGLNHQHFSGYGATPLHLNYSEAYVGVAGQRFSTRLYYSPNYNGSGHNMLYLENSAVMRPADGWRIAGHVGVLQAANHWRGGSMKPRYDGRIDVIRSFGRAEVSVGWAQATPDIAEPKKSRGGVIVGASVFF
jgi:uncharacterized protein (TIGR02001 family)